MQEIQRIIYISYDRVQTFFLFQDRNGTVFARSEPVYDLIISPKDILYKEESKKTGKKVQKYEDKG